MRADAARNAQKLRTAATALFSERGLTVPLKEIARAAEVSHGTIYNLYGSREALINEVVGDIAMTQLEELGNAALDHEDPWQGFVFYVEETCSIQVSNPAIGDVLSGRFPEAKSLMGLCASARKTAEQVVERAHKSGQLRTDFTNVDLALTFGALANFARSSNEAAPEVWRRTLHFLLDGLRSEATSEQIEDPELNEASIYAALGSMTVGPKQP